MKIGDRVKINEYLSVNRFDKDYADFCDFYDKNNGKETVITGFTGEQFKLKIDNGKYFWYEDELVLIKENVCSKIEWVTKSTKSNKNNTQNDFFELLADAIVTKLQEREKSNE